MKTTFDKMVEFLDSAWCVRDEIVPCLVGPVGIGKTRAVARHCENMGAKRVVKIVASQILPNEVSGITMPDAETKAMEIYDHYRLSSLEDGDILFFDELLEADQLVLSACLTLIESRELMSGRKLPDIQIVAATNPTVKPASLKANIRQRFLFRTFQIDRDGTSEYIMDEYGIDVGDLTKNLEGENDGKYNILSPRSLTKMARWITSVPEDEQKKVAEQINLAWGTNLGTELFKRLPNRSAEAAARDALYAQVVRIANNKSKSPHKYLFENGVLTSSKKGVDSVFEETSMDELLDMMKKLPDWDLIEKSLSEIDAPDKFDAEVEF